MPEVIVEGLLVNYQRSGSGKTVLLLHGWGDSSKTFAALTEHLVKQYEVIAPDLAGFGGSQSPKKPWGLDDYVGFISAFLKKQGSIPYAIIGHSNGGAIALRGVGQGTLKAEKLVLLASSGLRDTHTPTKRLLRLAAKSVKLVIKPLPRRLQNRLKKRAYAAIGSELFVAEHMQETFRRVITDDVRDDATQISVPTLLLYGNEDKATPIQYGEQFAARIAQSRLQVIEGAGHFIHHDKQMEVTKLIEDFLAGKK